MNSLRKILVNLLIVGTSVGFCFLAAELTLRLLPVAWAPPITRATAEDPIQRYTPNSPFVWSLGWNFYEIVRGRTNAQGFVADYDYDPRSSSPLIVVLGNSYVEALMLPFAQSLTGRLQAALGSKGRAYAIAQSGASLSQYVAYAKHACAVYRPQRLMVAVFGGDFDNSLYARRIRGEMYHLYPRADGSFDWKLTPGAPPGLGERVMRNSALALYLVRNANILNLRNLIRNDNAYVGNTSAAVEPERLAEGERVIHWFLNALPEAACLAPRDIAIMVDAMRPQIYDDRVLAAARESFFGRMRETLISEAAAKGFVVVDMERAFRADYKRNHRIFEFRTDAHWTSSAHAVAAAAAIDALSGWEPLASAVPQSSMSQ